jgi:hypothetical protein
MPHRLRFRPLVVLGHLAAVQHDADMHGRSPSMKPDTATGTFRAGLRGRMFFTDKERMLAMQHDHEHVATAVRQANGRIARLQEKVAGAVVALNEQVPPSPGGGHGFDLPCTLYGIKQVSIDSRGLLRLVRRAGERELLATARLYAAVAAGFHWALVEVREITEHLLAHEDWRRFSLAEAAAVQARMPDLAGAVAPETLRRYFTHSYVCGELAPEYPEHLLRMFPSTARIRAKVQGRQDHEVSEPVVAMQLALIDQLMLSSEAAWQQLIAMN